MVNVSREKWQLVKKKLPKNYRELVCKMNTGISVRQVSMVISGESKDILLNEKVKGGVREILRRLGYNEGQIQELL